MSEEDWRALFPENACLATIAELSVWTSVGDCLIAARWIEERSSPGDAPSDRLIIPYPDDQEFEVVFTQCLHWLIQSFRAPPSKVRLAALLDRHIAPQTCAALLEARFMPNVDQGPAGVIGLLFPPLAHHAHERFFVVKDSPHVIELVQTPLRCLVALIGQAWPTATRMRQLREQSLRESGTAPTIVHQPYVDGPLFSLIEALAFHAQGLAIGPDAVLTAPAIERGYRSVQVVGRPPIEPRLLAVAQQLTTSMWQSLE